MEAQVAPSQQLAATQSQKPTQTTQPYDPANDPTVQVEADADEASDGEEGVRRAISASLPRSIARRGVSHPPRATPGAARAARARLFPRTAVPFLTLFPLRLRPPRQYEQLPQSFLCIEELQNCGISMTDIKVRASAADARPSRAPRCPSPPLRARALKPDVVFSLRSTLDAERAYFQNEKSHPLGSRDAPRGRR